MRSMHASAELVHEAISELGESQVLMALIDRLKELEQANSAMLIDINRLSSMLQWEGYRLASTRGVSAYKASEAVSDPHATVALEPTAL